MVIQMKSLYEFQLENFSLDLGKYGLNGQSYHLDFVVKKIKENYFYSDLENKNQVEIAKLGKDFEFEKGISCVLFYRLKAPSDLNTLTKEANEFIINTFYCHSKVKNEEFFRKQLDLLQLEDEYQKLKKENGFILGIFENSKKTFLQTKEQSKKLLEEKKKSIEIEKYKIDEKLNLEERISTASLLKHKIYCLEKLKDQLGEDSLKIRSRITNQKTNILKKLN